MDTVIRIAGVIYNLGSTVLVPVIILLAGLLLRLGFRHSLRSAALTMAALFGGSLILNRLGVEFAALAQAFSERYALASTATVLSYQVASTIAFSTSMVMLMLPIGILANLLLCLLRSCRTVNIDLWSYWQMAFTGMLVQAVTGSPVYAFGAAALHCMLSLLFADLSSSRTEKAAGLKGVAITHGFITAFAPIVWVLNVVIDLFPALSGKDITFDALKKRLGTLGEPALWCAAAGGAFAWLSGRDFYSILQFAMVAGALALLLPHIGAMFADGFSALSDKLTRRVNAGRRKGRVSIGFGIFIGMFNPTTLFITLLLIPFALWVGSFPAFDFVPTGDAAMVIYIAVAAVVYSGGGLIRSLLSGAASVMTALYCGRYLAAVVTGLAQRIDVEKYGGYELINSLSGGASPVTAFGVFASSYGPAGIALCLLLLVSLIVINRDRIASEHRMALAESGEIVYPISGDFRHWTHYLKNKPTLKKAARTPAQAEAKPDSPGPLPESAPPEDRQSDK